MNKENSNLYYFALIHIIAFSLAIAGCATQSKSIGLAGGIGAGGGAILGGIADPGKNGEYRTRNVVVGAALGGKSFDREIDPFRIAKPAQLLIEFPNPVRA